MTTSRGVGEGTEWLDIHRVKVDVGVNWTSRFESGTRKHVVIRDEQGRWKWVTACTGSRAVREYTGWLGVAVTCEPCKRVDR